PGHAAARLYRRHHDALAAGGRVPRRRVSPARALRPDLFGTRHDHDFLRCHADHHRADEFRGAVAARRARCRVPHPQFAELLAHRVDIIWVALFTVVYLIGLGRLVTRPTRGAPATVDRDSWMPRQ